MENNKPKSVFISHSLADRDMARLISDKLVNTGLNVFFDVNNVSPAENVFKEIKSLFQSNDFLLILLSKSLFDSPYFHFEYTQEFFRQVRQRKISVVPILIEKCNVPSDFLEYNILDLTVNMDRGIDKLIDRIKILPEIFFGNLDHRDFEEMVFDILKSYGFKNIKREQRFNGRGIDFIAEFFSKNPFGQRRKELWIIETKLYSESRFDIRTIKEIVDSYKYVNKEDAKLLLITNSQINSVVEDYINDVRKGDSLNIEVVDGFLLKQLVANKRGILNKYFLK